MSGICMQPTPPVQHAPVINRQPDLERRVLFAHIVRGAAARKNGVAILGHRQEVVDQISDALDELGLAHGFIAVGYEEDPDPQGTDR
jgi:hypothetical protein